jgi:hypothetical protein
MNDTADSSVYTSPGKKWVTPALISAGYMLVSYILIGFRPEQVFLSLLFIVLYTASGATRRFILGFAVFIVYWILYDYMKAFPNFRYNTVHIEDLYLFEKNIFGVSSGTGLMTLNEYFRQNGNIFLDVITALFYLSWIPLPLAFAFYLYKKNRREFILFSLAFFIVNIIGFIIYYLYPAAPPWYVYKYGFALNVDAGGSAAGLLKFDALTGVPLFQSIYSKGSNIFAAMPSLHSSYPLIVLYYGIKNRLGLINIPFAVFTAGIWFAAVYTDHHYVLDVIAGILCAIAGILLLEKVLLKLKLPEKLLEKYHAAITRKA